MSKPRWRARLRGSPRTTSALGALVLLLILLPVWQRGSQWYEGQLIAEQRAEAAVQTTLRANALSLAMGRRLARLQGLHAFAQAAELPLNQDRWAEFDAFAAELYANSQGIRSMAVARDSGVRYVYPLAGNEDLVGYRPLQDPRAEIQTAVRRALVTGNTILSGPSPSATGDLTLAAWLAIYRPGTSVGLVYMVVELPSVLAEAELDTPGQELAFALRDGVGRVFFGSADVFEHNPVVGAVDLPDGVWELAGAPAGGWDTGVRQPLQILQATGLVIIGLLAILVYLVINRQAQLALAVRQRTEELAQANELLEQRVEARSRQLAEQAGRLAVMEERQRIARELHDSVSQALYGIGLGTRTARALLENEPSRAAESLDYVSSLAGAGLTEMRALIFELRPDSLEKEGLVAALSKQAAALEARHKVPVRTDLGPEPPLPLEAKEALYRISQEALNNVVRHARAGQVELSLIEAAAGLVLEIRDDGVGFDPAGDYPGHLGLRSMQERAVQVGGRLEISSSPGAGTVLQVTLPLSP